MFFCCCFFRCCCFFPPYKLFFSHFRLTDFRACSLSSGISKMDSEQKQSEDDPENPRIECKSKRSVNVLLETLKEETMKLRNSINFSVKNDLEPLHRNLFQVFIYRFPTHCARYILERCFSPVFYSTQFSKWFLSHLLVAGCDIGVRFSVSPSVHLSTFMSTFDIYVRVSILINYKTKQPSNLA